MTAEINMAASQGSALSTIPSELVAVQAILEVFKPQRLPQIFASLCYLLSYNTDPQDYYFIVDPVDRPNLAGGGLEKFERLINTSTNSTIQLGFITETGTITAITMSRTLHFAVACVMHSSVSRGIPGVQWSYLDIGTPQLVFAIQLYGKPYALFLIANPGNDQDTVKSVRSLLPHVTVNHPSIKMIVQVQLRGLDGNIRSDNKDIEDRVSRISQHSSIDIWAFNGIEFIKDNAFSAKGLSEGGQLRLPLLGEETVAVLEYSDVLQVIRDHYAQACPLLGHPANKNSPPTKDGRTAKFNKGLQGSVFPLDAFKSGFTALTSRRGMLPNTGTSGLGLIKTGGSGPRVYGAAARNTATRLLSAGRLVGRLLRR